MLDRKIDLTRGADRNIPYTAKVRQQALHFRRLPVFKPYPIEGARLKGAHEGVAMPPGKRGAFVKSW